MTKPISQREARTNPLTVLRECAELLESLCAWMLHRFPTESPEAKEASFRYQKALAALRAAEAQTSAVTEEMVEKAAEAIVAAASKRGWIGYNAALDFARAALESALAEAERGGTQP